jgi:hypothetical protein
LFARGWSPEQVAEVFAELPDGRGESGITTTHIERHFEDYLMLSVWEKLCLAPVANSASSQLHRLIDDISDLRRIDERLDRTDDSTMVSLLDLKRKIKERMMKECSLGARQSTAVMDVSDDEFYRIYEEVFGHPPPAG